MADVEHLIGLLLGTEEDWPRAFETLLRRIGVDHRRRTARSHRTAHASGSPSSRSTCATKPRHDLVIDRLAYWYYHPREWLKKIALMDDVYLLNSPFTFQSMEKHAAYCAMMRLGLKVPETVLVPYKNPLDNARWAYTAAPLQPAVRPRRRSPTTVGYPLFMKPYDGGAWVGVSRIKQRRRPARRLRRVRRAAHAPAAVGRGLRRVRPVAVDRAGDDGDEVPARAAHARPVRGRARLPVRRDRATRS